jgi:hypothetical protein
MEPWVYGELVVLVVAVSGLICRVMQQRNLAIQTLLNGQTQISELRRRMNRPGFCGGRFV